MMAFLRLCCCGGVEEDYDRPYQRFDEAPSHQIRARPVHDGYINNGIDGTDEVDTAAPTVRRSANEVEEEAMNRILEHTQHNIIDVSHLDGLSLAPHDYLARQRDYNDGVNEHDHIVNKQPATQKTNGKNGRRLLEDCGNRAADWLGRAPLSRSELDVIRSNASQVSSAVNGIEITAKSELIVFMDS